MSIDIKSIDKINELEQLLLKSRADGFKSIYAQIKPAIKEIAPAYEKLNEQNRATLWADKEIIELLNAVGLKPFEAKSKTDKPEISDEEIIAFSGTKAGLTEKDYKAKFKGKIKIGALKKRLEQLATAQKIPTVSKK